jgi:hypothetical protein
MLNMELDLQRLFGLHAYSCTHLAETPQLPPPRIWGAVGQPDRRHFSVTPPGPGTNLLTGGGSGTRIGSGLTYSLPSAETQKEVDPSRSICSIYNHPIF